MKSELLTIRQELEAQKNMIGLVGTGLSVQEVQGNSLSAHIETDWSEINISYGRDLNLVPDSETQSFAVKRNIQDAHLKTGLDLLEHEAGHRENRVGDRYGCPYDLETHEQIKDSIARALKQIGKSGLESYVANAFEDVLDNVNCRRHTDFAGQTLFWNNQGLVDPENKGFNPFYEAFVKVNLNLAGRTADYSLLRRFFKNKKETNEAVNSFLSKLKSASREKHLFRLHEKPGFERLFGLDLDERTKLWADLGYEFAISLGKLLEDIPKQRMFGSSEEDENSEEQNPFDREMKIPFNRQKVILSRYQQGKGPAMHRDLQEQLYDLYKSISREIPVATSYYTANQQMPLVQFGRRFVKEDERKFRFRGLGFKEGGQLALKTNKHHQNHPVAYKKHFAQFPKFKLALIDRSGSMSLNPDNEKEVGDVKLIPWGDNSKYHFALKGYFGIDNFFERQGIAPYIESCALGFSGETSVRGKSELVAKSLLVSPSGGTSLDVSGLENELDKKALVLSISDGEFDLDESEKARFSQKIAGSDYAHIQIGQETQFSSYLRELGVPVIQVKGDEDLSRTMVSFVSNYYKTSPKIGSQQ